MVITIRPIDTESEAEAGIAPAHGRLAGPLHYCFATRPTTRPTRTEDETALACRRAVFSYAQHTQVDGLPQVHVRYLCEQVQSMHFRNISIVVLLFVDAYREQVYPCVMFISKEE